MLKALLPGTGSSANGQVVLVSEVLLANGAGTVVFNSIPQTFRDIEIRSRGRLNNNSPDASVQLILNGDNGNNYDWQIVFFAQTYAPVTNIPRSLMVTPQIPASQAPVGYSGAVSTIIANYRDNASYKSAVSIGNDWWTTNAARSMIGIGTWENTNPVTSVQVIPGGGSWANGSVVSLYGHL